MFSGVDALLNVMRELIFLTAYVEKGAAFPKPLTGEEEAKCIHRHLKGDLAARDTLIERNLRLVVHIAKKYANAKRDIDDLVSIGTIGLIKGVNTYNSNKGTQLATYAARCIENEILMSIRAAKKEKNEVYMQEPIGVDAEGNEISLLDVLGTAQDEVADQVELTMQLERLRHLIPDVLDRRELEVIELRYGLNNRERRTQKQIAAALKISRSYVSRIEKKALQKLSARFLEC